MKWRKAAWNIGEQAGKPVTVIVQPALTTSGRKYRKKLGMYKRQHGLCYWCGVEMLLPQQGEHLGRLPPHCATIDHLDSRLSSERGEHKYEFRQVLACYDCNHTRAREEVAALPIDELWRRSGRYPQEDAT